MRALAEFAMRGRAQAIGVAVLGLILPLFVWISAAVVGLVVLRRSGQDAAIVLGWALLVAFGVLRLYGDLGSEAAFFSSVIAALIVCVAAALVLRWTRSWPLALTAIVVCSLVSGLVITVAASGVVAQFAQELNELFGKLRARMPAGQADLLSNLNVVQVGGLLARFIGSLAVVGLLVARWWQASLFNPGGFREEFHRVRLPPQLAGGLVVVALLAALMGEDYSWWAVLFVMPLVVSGFALVHGVVRLKGWGYAPLVVLYFAYNFLGAVVMATLLLLALVDSWWDFRERLRARSK